MSQVMKQNDVLGTANRGTPCESGLCTLCEADCKGKCETWMASLLGRKLLYPRDVGNVTAGSANLVAEGVGYHALRIQGYAYGAHGLEDRLSSSADDRVFTGVEIETAFGRSHKTRCRLPIMTGALGSTPIAAKYWDSFAIGAAVCGFPIVVGENVVGIDKQAVIQDGRILAAPELDRRIETYRRYFDGFGAIIVQMNVEDARNGVAEYVIDRHGDAVIIELKWGQGAKDIGGEIEVTDIEHARFLKTRGYLIDPDPTDPIVRKAFEHGAIRSFARHSRLGATELGAAQEVRESFMNQVGRLRGLGFKRISLKTGSYGMEALAMAIRFAADADLDLLTIDGSGGGTGMSPWNMMDHWGVPSLPLHAKTHEYCTILESRGIVPPDISLAGGFAREDHVFKALSLGSPYAKLVCMGRAPMIPGFLGSNIEGVIRPERREARSGHWTHLPSTVADLGASPEEIFAGWESVRAKLGDEAMEVIPYGAVALYGYMDKLACGLQQFMAGARKFSIDQLSRDDLMAANHETALVTGIPYMTDAGHERALAILEG